MRLAKLGEFIFGLLAGLVASAYCAFVQAETYRFWIHWQIGVPLAVAIMVLLLRWLVRAFHSRLVGLGVLSAWVAFALVWSGDRTQGDVVFIKTGYTDAYFLLTAIGLGVAFMVKPKRPIDEFDSTDKETYGRQ